MVCKSPEIIMKQIVTKITYECPICRSVGSYPLKNSTIEIPNLHIECPTCQSGLFLTRITDNITVHYSTPFSDVKDIRRSDM